MPDMPGDPPEPQPGDPEEPEPDPDEEQNDRLQRAVDGMDGIAVENGFN